MEKNKVAFYTLGCKVNQYETNAMKQEFIEKGYEVTEFEEKSDIYVVNTCTVTNMSDRKSRQILRRAKEINPNSILVVTGCYAQVAKSDLEKIEEIDIVLGNTEKKDIVKYIEKYMQNTTRQEAVADIMQEKSVNEFETIAYTDKARAFIKIQDGCDRFCSYCIIPYARGRVRSRKIQDIVNEIKQIADKGIQEVVITGIHIASYGKEVKPHVELIDLLKEINKIEKIKRIRLGSLEPTIIQEEFVKELKKLNKVCGHFHLSLQSGCDETLQRMNRKYTTDEFKKSVELLKQNYPNVALTTDIIVGFPGETDSEFEKTYKYLDEINFYKMHIFKYSQRKGTKAAVMPMQINGAIKEERSRKLIEMSDKKQIEHNEKYIGKKVPVLIEEREGKYLKGHTTNYILVYIEEEKNIENEIVNVLVSNTQKEALIGKIV